VVTAGGLTVYFVAFNVRMAPPGTHRVQPFSDVRVRRALALVTDPQELIEKTQQGFGRPTTQLVVPSVFGFDPGIPALTHDPDAARALVRAAGFEGAQVALDVDAGSSQRTENVLAAQWRRSGLAVEIVQHSTAELARALADGRFSATVQGYVCTSADASELLSVLLHTRDPARGYGRSNDTGYSDPEVDAIAEHNLSTLDPRKRLVMLQRALFRASQDLPYLPLLSGDDIYVVADRLRWTPPNNGEIRLDEVAFAPEAR
jgi:peptide/nickel transport system substrate-binding protein